jgi:FMN reductase
MATIVGILGSVTPPGRSLKALEFAMRAALQHEPTLEARTFNLADFKISFADGRPPEEFGDDTTTIVSEIALAEAVILASPVYRGSFSGVLKNLLDNVPVEALRSKPCGIIAIGATNHHYLCVDWHLRDVLAWFGALVAPTSVYLSSEDFPSGEPSDEARRELSELAMTVLRLRAAVPPISCSLGPDPLAAHPRVSVMQDFGTIHSRKISTAKALNAPAVRTGWRKKSSLRVAECRMP